MSAGFRIRPKVRHGNTLQNPSAEGPSPTKSKFLSRTTITPIVQVHSATNKSEKFVWLLLFLVAVGMTAYQSCEMVSHFLSFSVVEKTRLEYQVPFSFPAVTVCSNVPITRENAGKVYNFTELFVALRKNGENPYAIEPSRDTGYQNSYTDYQNSYTDYQNSYTDYQNSYTEYQNSYTEYQSQWDTAPGWDTDNQSLDAEYQSRPIGNNLTRTLNDNMPPTVEELFNIQREIFVKLAKLSYAERISYGLPEDEYIHHCFYSWKSRCTGKLFISNNLYYGNCATFNPGSLLGATNANAGIGVNEKPTLFLLLSAQEANEDFLSYQRHDGLLIMIHEPNTAPIPESSHVLKLFAGDFMEILVSKKDIRRLPWPYTTQCIKRDTPSVQLKNLYHNEHAPYLYTAETCINSCIQNLSRSYCGCFHPTVPIRLTPEDLRGNTLEVCNQDCAEIPSDAETTHCECHEVCESSEYIVDSTTSSGRFQKGILAKQLNNSIKAILDSNIHLPPHLDQLAGVFIRASCNVEVVEEVEEMPVSALYGAIGGLFGLWIGISIMSILEIISEVFKTVVDILTQKPKSISPMRPIRVSQLSTVTMQTSP